MILTRLNTSELPGNLVLIVTAIALVLIALIVVLAMVMDCVDKTKNRRSKK